ncbi:MAG TPA: choice-of-anchor tandem repeat GloVer-containing protein [Rhizomicrobium sp.]|nr:choice-of-anchor tandem repeat GloVer-containing protein [Rhizomicrobium sp.]
MTSNRSGKIAFACGTLALLLLPGAAGASGYAVVYSFAGGSDGAGPTTPLSKDKLGNLYGTAGGGGTGCGGYGCGTVFKLAPDGTETVLYAFNGNDGYLPNGGLVRDKAGNLYGTTEGGGIYDYGTVFVVAPDGTEKVLYSFCAKSNCSDGAIPYAGLIDESAHDFYGTTTSGGDTSCTGGCGTVFEVRLDGKEKVLHAFHGGSDGYDPQAALYADSAGNLYGTTGGGGSTSCSGYGCGTVFKIAPDGSYAIVYVFKAGNEDGWGPLASLVADSVGNLYSTTIYGGAYNVGTVFRIAPDGAEGLLYSFKGRKNNDGAFPRGRLRLDASGNLYGTTSRGGGGDRGLGGGTVFQLAPNGTETVLYAFCGGPGCREGKEPSGDLTWNGSDKTALYGTADGGAHGKGVVFSYTLAPGKKN